MLCSKRTVDPRLIHVVAAAVTAPDGGVLIAERPPGKPLAGHWEFPGGKLEPGETRAAGLARELREELGITIRDPRPLMRVRHAYDFGEVLVDLWVVRRYSGEPQGLDGQRMRWCALDELGDAGLLLADRALVRALRLPERLTHAHTRFYSVGDPLSFERQLAVTRPNAETPLRGEFCDGPFDAVRGADQGAQFIVLRRSLPDEELAALCHALYVPVFASGIELAHAWERGATGVSDLEA